MNLRVSIVFLATALAAASCSAQLRELSRGDLDAKWKQAQIDILESQLEGQESGPLRKEIESQVKWLKLWQPNKLSPQSIWGQKASKNIVSEPILDPQKRAAQLRQRLLGKNARPTANDTKQLESLLKQYPKDIGVRQLHLHWLDQIQYRKDYADDIANVCDRLIVLLDAAPGYDQSRELKRAKAFCLYRKGRALAYRELPDVVAKKPIDNPVEHGSRLQATYQELIDLVGFGRPEFVLLDIRMLRRDNWQGRALALLEENGRNITQKWYLKKRRDLLTELGWEKPAQEAAAIYEDEYPDAVALEKKSTQVRR